MFADVHAGHVVQGQLPEAAAALHSRDHQTLRGEGEFSLSVQSWATGYDLRSTLPRGVKAFPGNTRFGPSFCGPLLAVRCRVIIITVP